MEITIRKTIIASLLIGMFSLAHADNQASTSLVMSVPQYSSDQLTQAGCDQNVWNKMVSDYQSKAQTQAAIGEQAALNQKNLTPSATNVASCFDSASQLVNNATRAYNTVVSLLTGGGLDTSQLYGYAQKLVVGAACSQVNQMVNSSGIGTQIGQVNSTIGGTLNTGTNIGGINTGSVSQILNGGGYQQNTSNNTPFVDPNKLANSSGATGILDSINPFK
ncbi:MULTISPECIES: hypothetical protein [Burkholderiaceae]|uniref:hypothetical protein n=1 Tax=Burkholderiaceae TaxID=119060 RepID=UPI001C9764A6|nr:MULTISPECIES: hypothetical protein [Burkholderiaceae]MBY4717547.1 hypothetical protein [Ralstonia mannitolilytica]MCW5156382.1 hypothetical protein [Burkholderia cenocepacia]